jgi:flavin-binding protein dodecin
MMAEHSIYKVVEIVGTSKESWEDAAKAAVLAASKSLRDLRVAEVRQFDLKIEDGSVTFRVKLDVSFKLEDADV